MNLELIIKSDKKYKSKGTGVFVRDSSGTRELQTLDEIRIYYPDFDLSNITQEYYESYNVWEGYISHNLAYLASHVKIGSSNLYNYLWKPSEIGYIYLTHIYIERIEEACKELEGNKELEKFGSREEITELLEFVKSLYNCLSKLNINYSDEFEIISTR